MPTYWDAFQTWCQQKGISGDEYDFVGWMMTEHPQAALQAKERHIAAPAQGEKP